MRKIYVLQGLPASGKSTKAKELVEADKTGHTIRLNRDLLREMMHFGVYSKQNERHIMNAEKVLAQSLLVFDFDVVVDDTNLKQKTIDMWKDVASWMKADIEIVRIDTPLEVCIERDSKREKPVGEKVIRDMMNWDLIVDSH